ncbi:unnamed protein product [Peniophora sp. CBMAI 1063]|nr:unnamed protein product [Peniophora sp. CBMAI 1063]
MKTPSLLAPFPFTRSHSASSSHSLSLSNLLHEPSQQPIQIYVHSHAATSSESIYAAAEENARRRRHRRDVRNMDMGALVRRSVVRSDRSVRVGESSRAESRCREDEENPLRAERLRSRTSTREAYPLDVKEKGRTEKNLLRAARNKPLPAVPPPYSARDRSLPWLERAQKHFSDPGAQAAARISDLFSDSEPESETVVDAEVEVVMKRGRPLRRRQGVAGLREQAQVESMGEGSTSSTVTIAPPPEHLGWSQKAVINGYSVDKADLCEIGETKTKTKFEHIERWLNANALYKAEDERKKQYRAQKKVVAWKAAELNPHASKKWAPPMYRLDLWKGDASSSSSREGERGRSGGQQRSRGSTRTVRTNRRDGVRTPRPSRASRRNVQILPSPPSTHSSATKSALSGSSHSSYKSCKSECSDHLSVQLEDLQQSVRELNADDDARWVWKMYMSGLDRAQRIGLPFAEAQEQALAATAYEVQEVCARALEGRS